MTLFFVFTMYLQLCCIFYFVIVVFGVNDTYIHFSDDETDQYFPSDTVHADGNDDFEFPWAYENTSQQNETSTSQQPEPTLSLEKITNLFAQQYTYRITDENRWYELEKNPDDSRWNNLCDQTWEKKGHQDYIGIKCTGQQMQTNSKFWVNLYGYKYKANFLKCSCPPIRSHKHRESITKNERFFFVTRHTDENYFTLISVRQFILIVHGYVMNLPESPFSAELETTRKYYYRDEAEKIYYKFN